MDIEKAICNLKENIEMPFGITISKETSKMIIESLQELQQYRQIGTVDECRTAKEKTNPMKPKVNKSGTFYIYYCPICKRRAKFDYDLHCNGCGQALKWGD